MPFSSDRSAVSAVEAARHRARVARGEAAGRALARVGEDQQQAAADEKGGCALGVAFVITSTNKEDLLLVGLESIFWSGF